jgi:hypothetical protein
MAAMGQLSTHDVTTHARTNQITNVFTILSYPVYPTAAVQFWLGWQAAELATLELKLNSHSLQLAQLSHRPCGLLNHSFFTHPPSTYYRPDIIKTRHYTQTVDS